MMKNAKIKANQKLRIIRYIGANDRIIVRCQFKNLRDTLDGHTSGAVEDALEEILKAPCGGIGATFRGMSLQVDLVD